MMMVHGYLIPWHSSPPIFPHSPFFLCQLNMEASLPITLVFSMCLDLIKRYILFFKNSTSLISNFVKRKTILQQQNMHTLSQLLCFKNRKYDAQSVTSGKMFLIFFNDCFILKWLLNDLEGDTPVRTSNQKWNHISCWEEISNHICELFFSQEW